jgi:hypothetical protein
MWCMQIIGVITGKARDLLFPEIFGAFAQHLDGHLARLLVVSLTHFQSDGGVIWVDVGDYVWCVARDSLFAHCCVVDSVWSRVIGGIRIVWFVV